MTLIWLLFNVAIVVHLVASSIECNKIQRKNENEDARDELVCAHVVRTFNKVQQFSLRPNSGLDFILSKSI